MYAATHMVNRAGMPVLATETRLLFMLTFAVCVVIPHSLQEVTAGLIVLTGLVSLFVMRSSGRISYIGVCYILGAIVTCFYVAVGMANRAPTEAVIQTVAIYMVSPLLWIIILRTALQLMTIEQLTRYMVILAWLCCASVALFFYLYMNFGRDAVTFFIEVANVYVGRGFSGATMHVYGSLIFLTAAFFAAPEMIRNKAARIALLSALAVSALTSGRSALILAIPAGLLVGMVVRQLAREETAASGARKGMWVRYLLFIVTVAALVLILDSLVPDIDAGVILQGSWEKLLEGGGEARTDQNAALWQGISETWGLGAGHGIGAIITRSEFSWRYENVPLAVLFKVGFVGAIIYALPFLIYMSQVAKTIVAGTLTGYDKFMFAGLMGVLLAAPTNPYLESFIFQWMFILPLISLDRHRAVNGSVGTMRSLARREARPTEAPTA